MLKHLSWIFKSMSTANVTATVDATAEATTDATAEAADDNS